jgi:hypothetical protein
VNQPVVGPQHRHNCVGETQQQKPPGHPSVSPWGERAASPFLALIQAQRRSRPLGVPSKPWQPISRGLREIPSQPQDDDCDAERDSDNPGDEIAAHRRNIPRGQRRYPQQNTRRTRPRGSKLTLSRSLGAAVRRSHDQAKAPRPALSSSTGGPAARSAHRFDIVAIRSVHYFPKEVPRNRHLLQPGHPRCAARRLRRGRRPHPGRCASVRCLPSLLLGHRSSRALA